MTPDAFAELLAELRALRDEVRGLRAELRRTPAVVTALEEVFGPTGRFTAAGVLALVEEEPHSDLAQAVALLVDLNASPHARATALGAKLARMAEIETVARSHGCAVYRVASPT